VPFVSDLVSFSEVASMFEHMSARRSVDSSVIGKLETLVAQARHRESFWLKRRAVSRDDAFVMYHSWRNMRLVLSKMKSRVEVASTAHENPKVVTDSLEVLPCAVELFSALYCAEGGKLDENGKLELLERVTTLRSVASQASMLPSLEEELAEVDEKIVNNELAQMARAIGAGRY